MLNRRESISKIRRACLKANPNLWDDHGDVLKRRIAPGMAVPAKLGLVDVLLALKAITNRNDPRSDDEDEKSLVKELIARVVFAWDLQRDDLDEQDDECIHVVVGLLL